MGGTDGESVIGWPHRRGSRLQKRWFACLQRAADRAAGRIFRLPETIVAGVVGKCAAKPDEIKFRRALLIPFSRSVRHRDRSPRLPWANSRTTPPIGRLGRPRQARSTGDNISSVPSNTYLDTYRHV
jgi:hypothetical protein